MGNASPRYPYRARRMGLEGRVVLRVEVSPHGESRSVAVVSGSGHDILDRAAVRAVRQWHFVPAKRAGIPVASTVDIPISFKLTD